MNRSIIASVALATALFVACNTETKEVPVEIPANTTPTVNTDSLAELKADSMLQASKDSLARVDSMLQVNDRKAWLKKKAAEKAAAEKAANTKIAPPTNPDGSASTGTIRKSR
ncbi:MAG: hypothetical protein SGJ05_07745 [bacterium]|nr:hypothetical protein [bacterium]